MCFLIAIFKKLTNILLRDTLKENLIQIMVTSGEGGREVKRERNTKGESKKLAIFYFLAYINED